MRSDRNSETEYFGTARLSKFASTIPSIPSDGEDATNWVRNSILNGGPSAGICWCASLARVLIQVPNPGRKAGRPIMYTGDPNAPGLTSLERRTIARRYANRQSARRIRLRRQDHLVQLEDEVQMSAQVKSVHGHIILPSGAALCYLCLMHLLHCLSRHHPADCM